MELSTTFIVLLVIMGIMAVGILVTNIVFSFKYKEFDLANDTLIEKIHKEIDSKLIDSISLKSSCESGEEELILEKWDGDSSKSFTVINGNKICMKTKEETIKYFLDLKQIIPKNDNCPADLKSCGIIDTLDRKLCVVNSYTCPINSLNFVKKDQSNSELYKGYNSLYIGNGYNMYYLNQEGNDDSKIISIVKISAGYPCIEPSERNWKSYIKNGKTNEFSCTTKIKETYYDTRYTKFDDIETNYLSLYEQNGLSDYITDELKKDNTKINLYGRPYIGVDITEFDYDKIISLQDSSNTCNLTMKIVSYIMLGFIAIPLCGIFSFLGLGGSRGGECQGCSYTSGDDIFKYFGIVLVIIEVGGFLIHFITSIFIYISIQRLRWILVDNTKLGDIYTVEMLKLLIEDYSYNFYFALGVIIMIAVLFVSFIISIIILCKSEKY